MPGHRRLPEAELLAEQFLHFQPPFSDRCEGACGAGKFPDEYPWESLRATLAGDRSELERLYSATVEGTRRRWTLTLTPREVEVAGVVKSIVIAGSGSRIVRLEILEPGGDGSVMTIHYDSP